MGRANSTLALPAEQIFTKPNYILLYWIVSHNFSFVQNKHLIWRHFKWVVPAWSWHYPLSKFFRNPTISFVPRLYRIVPLEFSFVPKLFLIWSHFNVSCQWEVRITHTANFFRYLTISFVPLLYRIVKLEFSFVHTKI